MRNISDEEKVYWGTMRYYRMLDEDGAVKLYKKNEKAIAKLYRQMVAEMAGKMASNKKFKPNAEADEIFGTKDDIDNTPTGGVVQMPTITEVSSSPFAPTPEQMEDIRREAMPDDGMSPTLTTKVPYFDMDNPSESAPVRTQVAPANPAMPSGVPAMKRTIAPDGTRIE